MLAHHSSKSTLADIQAERLTIKVDTTCASFDNFRRDLAKHQAEQRARQAQNMGLMLHRAELNLDSQRAELSAIERAIAEDRAADEADGTGPGLDDAERRQIVAMLCALAAVMYVVLNGIGYMLGA